MHIITLRKIPNYFIVIKNVTASLGSLLNSGLSLFLKKKKINHEVSTVHF